MAGLWGAAEGGAALLKAPLSRAFISFGPQLQGCASREPWWRARSTACAHTCSTATPHRARHGHPASRRAQRRRAPTAPQLARAARARAAGPAARSPLHRNSTPSLQTPCRDHLQMHPQRTCSTSSSTSAECAAPRSVAPGRPHRVVPGVSTRQRPPFHSGPRAHSVCAQMGLIRHGEHEWRHTCSNVQCGCVPVGSAEPSGHAGAQGCRAQTVIPAAPAPQVHRLSQPPHGGGVHRRAPGPHPPLQARATGPGGRDRLRGVPWGADVDT